MELKFEWGWCETCGGTFVYCPKCGNNCCNAGHGFLNGENCDICSLAYQYQKLAWETKKDPSKKWIESNPAEATKKKSWFKLECERLRKYGKMSKKEKLQDIKNNSKAHKHCKDALTICCFVNDTIDMDLLKAHLKIDKINVEKWIKTITKEAKEAEVKII